MKMTEKEDGKSDPPAKFSRALVAEEINTTLPFNLVIIFRAQHYQKFTVFTQGVLSMLTMSVVHVACANTKCQVHQLAASLLDIQTGPSHHFLPSYLKDAVDREFFQGQT